jgi:hypothetical protein
MSAFEKAMAASTAAVATFIRPPPRYLSAKDLKICDQAGNSAAPATSGVVSVMKVTCARGVECAFAHSDAELASWKVAKENDERVAVARLTTARPLPEKYNGPHFQLCLSVTEARPCREGEHCTFAHSQFEIKEWTRMRQQKKDDEARERLARAPKTSGPPGTTRPPPAGLNSKAQLCNYQMAGYCQKGALCSFAHSVDEVESWEAARVAGTISQDLSSAPYAVRLSKKVSWEGIIRPRPNNTVRVFQICRHFRDSGSCRHNVRCNFGHSDAECEAWNRGGTVDMSSPYAEQVADQQMTLAIEAWYGQSNPGTASAPRQYSRLIFLIDIHERRAC